MAELLIASRVSNATGWNRYVWLRTAYLDSFLVAAASAAPAGFCWEIVMYDDATELITVTSHVRHLPFCHGISVTPSGRLPSVRTRPDGSFNAGIPAWERARATISLTQWCRADLPGACLQEKQWVPRVSTSWPQEHVWASQILTPRRRPTATRMASLLRRRPHEETDSANNQSPLCGADTSVSLAL